MKTFIIALFEYKIKINKILLKTLEVLLPIRYNTSINVYKTKEFL